MRDPKTSKLASDANAHSLQRLVSKPVLNLIGLSGGKDSTALWGWAFNESGYDPKTIVGVFTDVVNEYDETYQQIKTLDAYGQARGSQPVVWLQTEGFLNLALRKKRFPSARARFCTEELKIKPLKKYVDGLKEKYDIVSHSGVRRTESTERSLMEEWASGGLLDCKIRRPLLDWTISDVWTAHKKYGLPINPLYFTGRKRVGCKLCCMSNKQDVRITVKTKPETINQYRAWENIVGAKYEHNGGKPFSGFFRATTVPEIQRSRLWTNKKGKTFKVATIDDVTRWAFTLRGGTQAGFDFMFDDEPIYENDDTHAPCKSGYCE